MAEKAVNQFISSNAKFHIATFYGLVPKKQCSTM